MNLENLNVQELNTEELKSIDGGRNAQYEGDGLSLSEWWDVYLINHG
jgi:bacteriocin-like protein